MKDRKKILLLTSTALVLGIGILVAILATKSLKQNLAQDFVKLIEKELVKNGATRLCSKGDSGTGSDNQNPWYGVTFRIHKNKGEAIGIATQIASQDGYNLQHATPEDKGFLDAVGDNYINDWYFDESSKQSPYNELKNGKVQFSIIVRGEGSKNDCDQSKIKPGETTIGIGVTLPEFK